MLSTELLGKWRSSVNFMNVGSPLSSFAFLTSTQSTSLGGEQSNFSVFHMARKKEKCHIWFRWNRNFFPLGKVTKKPRPHSTSGDGISLAVIERHFSPATSHCAERRDLSEFQ